MKKKAKRKFFLPRLIAFITAVSALMPSSLSATTAADGDFYLSENYAQGKTCWANNAYSQAPKEMALDGDTGSYWRTNSTCADDFIYLAVDLGGKKDINLIYFSIYRMSCMSAVKLQYTDDPTPDKSSEWRNIKVLTNKILKEKMTVSFETVKRQAHHLTFPPS